VEGDGSSSAGLALRFTTQTITIGRSAGSSKPMARSEISIQKRDEAEWLDFLLETWHSARSAEFRRRRPSLLTRYQPGVYVVESPVAMLDFAAEARENGYFVAWVNGKSITSHEAFLADVSRRLQFPAYFGQNWDAFEECIRDLDWLPARGYVLVLDGFDWFARSDPKNWKIGLDVLEEAVNTWSRTRTPMYVLLHGPRDGAPGVKELRCADHKV
jgi:hypothetical protein